VIDGWGCEDSRFAALTAEVHNAGVKSMVGKVPINEDSWRTANDYLPKFVKAKKRRKKRKPANNAAQMKSTLMALAGFK